MKKLLILPILVILFFSCTSSSVISLNSSGGGTGTFSSSVQSFLIDFIGSMEVLDTSSTGKTDFYKTKQIEERFNENSEVNLLSLLTPDPASLNGEFSFSDIKKVFEMDEELKNAGIIKIEKTENQTALYLNLNKENYKGLTILKDIMENPLFEEFGPETNDGLTDEEYYELMEYALGEEGVQGLKESFIVLIVNVGSNIIETNGVTEGKSVSFKIPLIRILLLDQPLYYYMIF